MGRIRITGLLLVLVLLLAGCGGEQAHTQQLFAMDTIMNLTAYGGKGEQALSAASEKIGELEKWLSVTDEGSEIYAINHAGGQWVQVSQDTYDLISTALSLCRATGGALDITAYPAVRAWGFTTGEYRVPGEAELEELAAKIDYNAVELDESTCSVRLPQGMELDLGAVAKGWAGRCLAELLRQSGVKSAVLALGGNAQTVGTKPGGPSWRVGIQDPAGSQGAYLATVAVEDKAVVTSGGYQRYFEQDGQTYWHIIDPATAAPARSGVISATIVAQDGAVCDGLSTALFVMGADGAAGFWRERQDWGFDYILVLEDGSLQITQGLEDSFSLAQGYEDREVTVIAP